MGAILNSCRWLCDDGYGHLRRPNGLMLNQSKKYKVSHIPVSQLKITDVICEDEVEEILVSATTLICVY